MNKFSFNISLSVLNHLGRNLYRSFITVLGEAVSNSWDAYANNVWIYLDKKKNYLVIKDDGIGMNDADFQNKFLKIGYSKRKDKNVKPSKERPFIGRKGIGKLALLSCANKISIITKTSSCNYVGGTIDNSTLDKAITDDLTPSEYPLETVNDSFFESFKKEHKQGTIIYFENIKDSIKNTEEYLKYAIALYFRFSLIDNSFKIFFNNEPITIECLSKLADNTQFLWKINNIEDPYLDKKVLKSLKKSDTIKSAMQIKGFIASVKKPKDLKILTTEEKVSIDLYVNGRLREKDILRHISSARIVENYLYGQIHFDELDGDIDRFTSSREGIVSDDPLFDKLKNELKQRILTKIIDDWDKWRTENKEDGDMENKRYTPKQRKSKALYNEISKDFELPEDSTNKNKVDNWISELEKDAGYNLESYAECFISENLLRKYIHNKGIALSKEALKEITRLKKKEEDNKGTANLSIDIRKKNNDTSYLSMDDLANLVDKVRDPKKAGLSRDAKDYKPIRDALAHTALLTNPAKQRLTSTYENIKARIKKLLESNIKH